MMIVTLNDHVYEMSERLANKTIAMASEATKGTFAIYALTKGNLVQMRNDTYQTARELQQARALFMREGFRVRYHTRGADAS